MKKTMVQNQIKLTEKTTAVSTEVLAVIGAVCHLEDRRKKMEGRSKVTFKEHNGFSTWAALGLNDAQERLS